MYKFRLLIAALALIAFSCKDDDNDPSPEALLATEKGWRITAYTVDPPIPTGSGSSIIDLYAQMKACDRDDTFIFASAGTYKVENPVKCDDSEDTITESGSWTLSSDKKTLKLIPANDDSYELTVTSITKTTMKVTFIETVNSTKYTETVTFTAQ